MSNKTDQADLRRFGKYKTQIEPVMSDPIIRGYFTLVASFLLIAFFIFFALSPTFSTVVGLVRKIDDQKKTLQTLDSKITNLITAQENYSQIESKLPLLDSAMPQTPMPQAVLQEILATSTFSGVTITTLQIGDVYLSGINPKRQPSDSTAPVQTVGVASNIGIPNVPFSVSFTGDKAQIRNFIGTLMNLPRIMTISTITVGENVEEQTKGELNADMTGNAYYYPNP